MYGIIFWVILMNMKQAIHVRISRRTYTDEAIHSHQQQQLIEFIDQLNQTHHTHIQWIENATNAFKGLTKSYGFFHGVKAMIALVGKSNDALVSEVLGYCGEMIVLKATTLSLGTCFVGGTFDRKQVECELGEDEKIICAITIGNVIDKASFKEKVIRNMTHRRTKTISDVLVTHDSVPKWVTEGIDAVLKAPSAINKQPVLFHYEKNQLKMYITNTNGYDAMDFGIAKANFEIATGKKIPFGNPAQIG